MPNDRTRIFICTSHISCVYMALFARDTWAAGMKDILLVDTGIRRSEVVRSISEAASLHRWRTFHSFSEEVGIEHRFEPSLRKRLTRRWKGAPVIRTIYSWLLKRYMSARDRRYAAELMIVLGADATAGSVEVFAHTETYLRHPLQQLFPSSACTFMEHGQGDYIHIIEGGKPIGQLRALFAVPFKCFLERYGQGSDWVLPLRLPDDFPAIAADLLAKHELGNTAPMVEVTMHVVYVLLEALDMYNVPPEFWGAYIEHIIGSLDDPKKYHFILKPHPRQSALSMEHTRSSCDKSGITYSILEGGLGHSLATEIEFARWAGRTEHVFCLVSSGCFYLSQLYRDLRITYHYSTEFMERWIGDAPPQYKRLFAKMKPLISEVLAERCVPY